MHATHESHAAENVCSRRLHFAVLIERDQRAAVSTPRASKFQLVVTSCTITDHNNTHIREQKNVVKIPYKHPCARILYT